MKNVTFDDSGVFPVFRFEHENGDKDRIVYRPSIKGLWESLDKKDFSVELLINPLLNRARHVYNIVQIDDSRKRVGMVFPVSALDTEDSFEKKA